MREPMHLSMSSRGKIWEAIQDAKDQNAHVSLGPDQILVNGRNQNYIACVPFLLLSYTQNNMRYLWCLKCRPIMRTEWKYSATAVAEEGGTKLQKGAYRECNSQEPSAN